MIPSIEAHEPVYRNVDAEESEMVVCELQWNSDKKAFVNHESQEEWILDDHRFQEDSYYMIEGDDTIYDSREEAANAALSESEYFWEDVTIIHNHN